MSLLTRLCVKSKRLLKQVSYLSYLFNLDNTCKDCTFNKAC